MTLSEDVVRERMEYAEEVDFDEELCSEEWGIARPAVRQFIRQHIGNLKPSIEKPEYENQRMFDIQVLTKNEWCAKWSIPLWEYGSYLRRYEREHGDIATPEIRAMWMKEYWEGL